MNFHDFIAPTDLIVTDRQKSQRVGRALVEFDDWQVVLDTVQNISDLTPSLRYTSGYAITHVGCLARRGEKPFSSDEAEDILTAFHVFLSFCRGFWVDPTLPIGIDVNGETCWEDWRVREQDPWESRISWFDEHHGELLGEVFPGFWRLWKTPSWRDAIRIAVYWYIRSNNSRTGTDGAIILTQAGLEQLAWSFLVQNENALSMDGFEKLSAADQIRLLLTALKIPRTIPSELNQLSSLAKEHNWDGPAAFTEMRNSLVHPRKMQRTKSKLDGERLPITDAWSLGLWYFELALLSLFGHTGVYAERYRLPRSIGEVGNVPWATPH
jgi:hypothetical protein